MNEDLSNPLISPQGQWFYSVKKCLLLFFFFFLHINPMVQSNWPSVRPVGSSDIQGCWVLDGIRWMMWAQGGPHKGPAAYSLNEPWPHWINFLYKKGSDPLQ